MRRLGWFAAWPAGLALGVTTAVLTSRDPAYAFAGSGVQIVVELLAGYALIASGLLWIRCRRSGTLGMLYVGAGCGWFLVEWNNPGVGAPLVFTVGLVLYVSTPPLLAHALLATPGPAPRVARRAVIAIAYAGSLLGLGLLPALVYDPGAQGCSQCPRNLLLVHGSPALYQQFNRVGIYIGLAWTVVALALLAGRLARSRSAVRRQLIPVLTPGCAYLAIVAADFAASVHRGYLSNDSVDRWLRLGQAAALTLVALAPAWSWLRARRTRARLARLVVDLSSAPSPGGLGPALARSLGDPGVRIAYPIVIGRYVDAGGRPVDPGPTSTALQREGVEVAVVSHAPGLLDDPGLVETLTATARLALDHERLRAELLAHLAELRSSRERIVATGDRERRRLERDLHDGAQQRLVGLALALGLLSAQLEARPEPDPALLARVQEADRELHAALGDLRVLANGIFPAVLADEGLVAAVWALAEEEPGTIRIGALPEQRLDPAVESAAYRVIAEAVKHGVQTPLSVAAHVTDELLVIEIVGDGSPADLTDLEDRLGALDGTLELEHAANRNMTMRAEIPCAL
jgi:signal transduction histidine kinase